MGKETSGIQECLGKECPFLEDHNICVHKLRLDEVDICMLAHDNRVHTHEEIAKIMGISKQHVINLENKALDKMKRAIACQLKEDGLEVNDLFREH